MKNQEEYIYKSKDPCIDGFYSTQKDMLIFGARRFGPGKFISVASKHKLSPLPDNQTLGLILLQELELTKKPLTPSEVKNLKINFEILLPENITKAKSIEEFNSNFHPFSLWTKNDKSTPFFAGIPASELLQPYQNRYPIEKQISTETLDLEFQNFLTKFIRRPFFQAKGEA